MTIYIDSDYKCHVTNDGTMQAVDTDFFDGKCKEFIEGYRFIPEGEQWTRNDGKVFTGETAFPWVSYASLALAQSAADTTQEKADKQIMELLDVIEELIIGG